jgi:hypothetical protein
MTAHEQAITELGIRMEATFVPFSQSRHNDTKDPTLNWKVRLYKGDATRPFITTDYTAGMGHCPSYKQGRLSVDEMKAIRRECETGRTGRVTFAKPIEPKLADVVYSLVSDAEAIDYSIFDSWAESLGYDTDSRTVEATYRACVEIGLSLRAALGEQGLATLREAFQDY